MITIYDIAEKTGYSAPTVSKALNGTGSLNSETRKKILDTAKDMGYEPNMTAKALITKKSYVIGVVYEDIKMASGFQHPLFGSVLNNFRTEIEAAGYDLIFLSRKFNMSYLKHAKFRGVDGVVIINPDERDNSILTEMSKEGIACVSTNDYIEGIPTIITDNENDAYKGTEYLLSMGHQKIAFLAGPFSKTSPASSERYAGFRKCLKDNNIPFDESYFEECQMWDISSGFDGFAKLYERKQDFTALFCADDMLAFGVMQYAEKHNIKLPDDLSIIGFDDDRIASFSNPKLTTFQQDGNQIAALAADILLSHIAGVPAPEFVRIPAKFIERESVKKIN